MAESTSCEKHEARARVIGHCPKHVLCSWQLFAELMDRRLLIPTWFPFCVQRRPWRGFSQKSPPQTTQCFPEHGTLDFPNILPFIRICFSDFDFYSRWTLGFSQWDPPEKRRKRRSIELALSRNTGLVRRCGCTIWQHLSTILGIQERIVSN